MPCQGLEVAAVPSPWPEQPATIVGIAKVNYCAQAEWKVRREGRVSQACSVLSCHGNLSQSSCDIRYEDDVRRRIKISPEV